ncbi:DUF1971 domain-containing protein [Photobacterium leiognathi]|uniref:DUF1971 domain-containing protein n=1 Tax=Photobacterium leiognathi TaxID=553611 RepID=UPI002980AE10|nr:DUF1971 domain-containing protein [Photobacterium leiognathi]
MSSIPTNFVNYKSTPIFNRDTVPKMLVHEHNTREGVYGKISVIAGALKFYGFTQRRGDIKQEVVIEANNSLISPPQYWHKVELLSLKLNFKCIFMLMSTAISSSSS